MDQSDLKRLIYRRQYILCPRRAECTFTHNEISIAGDHFLYVHVDLPVTRHHSGDVTLILLGDIFGYRNIQQDNNGILRELYDNDFNILLRNLAGYAGRFVLFYICKNTVKVVHDAGAARKVYYGRTDEGSWLASQPYLLARMAGIPESTDPSKLGFYGSDEFHTLNNSNIGDTTLFDSVNQLLPNHYLDMDKLEPVRFWPFSRVNFLSVDEVADKCAQMLTGFIDSMANRYDIMVPITGGKDSRTIFSATRKISDRVFYYLNQEKFLDNKSNDIKIPRHLLTRLNLEFNLTDPYQVPVDKDFEAIYRQNMGFPLDSFLPHIYNYYLNFSDKVNLPGIFVGSAYEMFGTYNKGITPEILARLTGVEKYPHALAYYEKWLNNNQEICKQYNINLFVLFYWEERLSNWGTQIQLYKDIAQEDFMPYNSREFIECFFSAPPKYNDRPGYILYKKIISRLWPEALNEPFNPGFKHSLFAILHFLGILNLVRRWRFIWIYKMH
jgi:hypothetical protein